MTPPDDDRLMARTVRQLALVMGQDKANETVQDCLDRAGLVTVQSSQDLLLFAEMLIEQGGFIEVVGRALKAQALLKGARLIG